MIDVSCKKKFFYDTSEELYNRISTEVLEKEFNLEVNFENNLKRSIPHSLSVKILKTEKEKNQISNILDFTSFKLKEVKIQPVENINIKISDNKELLLAIVDTENSSENIELSLKYECDEIISNVKINI